MKVITTNRHTAYTYLMCKTGHEFRIAGEPWDAEQRPRPSNAKTLDIVERRSFRPDVVVGHAPTVDLPNWGVWSAVKHVPYVQVFHGRRERSGHRVNPARVVVKNCFATLLKLVARPSNMRFVFISESVKRSWRLPGTVVRPGMPLNEMYPYEGHDRTLLVVANGLHRPHFALDVLRELVQRVPIRIVGDNPTPSNFVSARARSWAELRGHYSACRAYLNLTREPEDGYNLATLEAMASGMPVLALFHPTSPVRDGENGFVGASAAELSDKAALVLNDWELAHHLGAAARETVAREFPLERFVSGWNDVLRLVENGSSR